MGMGAPTADAIAAGTFDEAKKIAMKRLTNPRIVPLVWYREAWDEQESIFSDDPWEYGLSKKNENTSRPCRLRSRAGLTRRKPALEELFLDVFQGRKRGVEFRV
jgi:4,5-dihydroxyphthalate decarboxylase